MNSALVNGSDLFSVWVRLGSCCGEILSFSFYPVALKFVSNVQFYSFVLPMFKFSVGQKYIQILSDFQHDEYTGYRFGSPSNSGVC